MVIYIEFRFNEFLEESAELNDAEKKVCIKHKGGETASPRPFLSIRGN